MNSNQIAPIASLIGEPALTAMLVELRGGRALTASELARAANVGDSTARAHLMQLLDAQWLRVAASGRHRYYAIASPEIARLVETLAVQTSASRLQRLVFGPRDATLRTARTCYDHLAGGLGVAIAQRLIASDGLVLEEEQSGLNERGRRTLAELGIEVPTRGARGSRTDPASCRPCLDWSERRLHIAGRLGAHICRCCLERGWLHRRMGSRAVDLTPSGRAALGPWLGHDFWIDSPAGPSDIDV